MKWYWNLRCRLGLHRPELVEYTPSILLMSGSGKLRCKTCGATNTFWSHTAHGDFRDNWVKETEDEAAHGSVVQDGVASGQSDPNLG